MIKIGVALVSLGIVCAIALWAKSPAVNGFPTAPSISVQEMHLLAASENLPIQEVEDQSVIYPTIAKQTK